MARSDLLISLIRSGSRGDRAVFQKTAEALIAEERAKRHDVLADQLAAQLRPNGHAEPTRHGFLESGSDLLLEAKPRRSLSDLLLSEHVRSACEELLEEHHRVDLLRSHNVEPRHRILLAGPPGNGKTSLAEALAGGLATPLLTVRYDTLVGSYLGETAQRLRRLFERARLDHCVLFFDEFETIGKERGDLHETGEIKRVVSSLLLQIDALPSHTVVVVASNHPELLDRAVWRRFQLRLELVPPNATAVREMLRRFEDRLGGRLGVKHDTIVQALAGASFAEVEDFCADIMRRYVLSLPDANLPLITRSRLAQLRSRFELSSTRKRTRRG
ncbi:MAG: AAA family ATPase [Deltaproteobacteria bacterium]|nr:AAA family ATPase [Deltaproteobacteria bacterium]